tara:strand:+ start:191676 stop:191945 length:270 start_codon:yes stop_codon:yes gene_type:complete
MKYVLVVLLFLLVSLQVRLFFGDGSVREMLVLKKEVNSKKAEVAILQERNLKLDAEVKDLKHRLSALEERARTDLGMVRKDETFYQNAN